MKIIEKDGTAYIVDEEEYVYWNGASDSAFRYVAKPNAIWCQWAEEIHYKLPMEWDIPYV
jgi:hypothetical protein